MSQNIFAEVEMTRIKSIDESENLLTIVFDNDISLTFKNENGSVVTTKK